MSNLSCGTHVAEPSANKDCRKLLNQFCRFLPKLKLPISADAKLPLTDVVICRIGYTDISFRKALEKQAPITHNNDWGCRTFDAAFCRAGSK